MNLLLLTIVFNCLFTGKTKTEKGYRKLETHYCALEKLKTVANLLYFTEISPLLGKKTPFSAIDSINKTKDVFTRR